MKEANRLKSSPHSRIHSGMCTSLFFKQRIVTRPLRVEMFQQYLAGELSEELLALSRRWVQKDQRSGRTHRRVRRGWKASSPMRLGSRYVSGRTRDWLKMKNPEAPGVRREAEEDWG
jgi:hypothetical protein